MIMDHKNNIFPQNHTILQQSFQSNDPSLDASYSGIIGQTKPSPSD